MPHIHGDLCEQMASEDLPTRGSFKQRVAQVTSSRLRTTQFCYSHGEFCRTLKQSDIEFSGLPCEENSRCNTKRKFMEGRFSNLYAVWAHRHNTLQTPLIILENTPEP